ncbi:uncharacterized protein LOC141849866 [Brevipalpus obovatus]|uniref:uncharacterized protein LOC141849866 n=1 Tax=Brevipalpus obovatus TaxID=246614 RepID=UPI003D9E0277
MDFRGIERKIMNSEYRCPEEMVFDLLKIEHLVLVRLGSCGATQEMTDYVNLMILKCQGADKCTPCAYDYFFGSYGQSSSCPRHRESNRRSTGSRTRPYERPVPDSARSEQRSSPPPPYSPQPERSNTIIRRTQWVSGRGEQEISGRSVRTDAMFNSADNYVTSSP